MNTDHLLNFFRPPQNDPFQTQLNNNTKAFVFKVKLPVRLQCFQQEGGKGGSTEVVITFNELLRSVHSLLHQLEGAKLGHPSATEQPTQLPSGSDQPDHVVPQRKLASSTIPLDRTD
jgi:hypothetical protein